MMETFTQTSHKSYDRHKYKLFHADGKIELYEWYDEVQQMWMTHLPGTFTHIEVIDRKKKR